MYSMHRIFCAAAGDTEQERQSFYQVMSDFNESHAMPRGILFVAVSLPVDTADKRVYQAAISENVRACRYYIQILEDTWGPPQKNFERDYALAGKCVSDPNLPMQQVAVLFKAPLLPHQVEPGITALKETLDRDNSQPHAVFDNLEEYRRELHNLLEGWLGTVAPRAAGA